MSTKNQELITPQCHWMDEQNGFTLVELILVILLIGIISVTVLPKWPVSSVSVEYEARRVLNDIRYTQALSMASGQRYRWVQLSSTSYQITNAAGTAVVLPSGSNQLTLTNGVTFSSLVNLPNNLLVFDSQGIPYTNTSTPGTALSATATITLAAGSQTQVIQVVPQTGFGAL